MGNQCQENQAIGLQNRIKTVSSKPDFDDAIKRRKSPQKQEKIVVYECFAFIFLRFTKEITNHAIEIELNNIYYLQKSLIMVIKV
ncbi:MAG: hypothetical protein JRI88_00470 [Deltaproteobacteria bacterium]|nr:hypothetical protein [Deltaproteobacteria bacterium]